MSDAPSPTEIELLPILPLRNSVVFPASVVPINVGRPRSVRLVEDLVGHERAVVGIVSQRDAEVDEPRFEDLYDVGTVARVVKVLRLGPNNYSVVLHGLARFQMTQRATLEPYMRARPRCPASRGDAAGALAHADPAARDGRHPRQRARERRSRRPHRVEPLARA